MARFTYDTGQSNKALKAAVMLFNGGPGLCLAVRTTLGKAVWFYEDGEVSIQSSFVNEFDKDVVQKFYEGDSITITF